MPQIYEVTAIVDDDRAAEFEKYMVNEHVPDVLATGMFRSAVVARSEDGSFVFGYSVSTAEELQWYLDNHAAGLRDDVVGRFGESVKTSRRMLDIVKFLPTKDLLERIVTYLEAVRKRPRMYLGRVEGETVNSFLNAFSTGIITAHPELDHPSFLAAWGAARRGAGWEDSAACVSREMRQRGLDEDEIVDRMIELAIASWRRVLR